MKLRNHYKNYTYFNDTVIKGTITMTSSEWKTALKYLNHHKVTSYYFDKTIFKQDIERKEQTKNGYLINIRVSATEILVRKYSLKHYQRHNYQILVLK